VSNSTNPDATLADLANKLLRGELSSRELIEECLDKIQDAAGEGPRTFRTVNAESARKAADTIDQARKTGIEVPPFAGIPISIKDLFDVAGEVTLAGSTVLADRAPATDDAPVVARLRAAGFVLIGRTNMTEFAYSGLGINPHYGTPLNPYDRSTGRIPGGSSAGAAVSVADGMSAVALGTDTGGSCRIPAAMCGIVGFKPTACRVPLDGVTPLSFSLDTVGPLANSVACCATIDEIISDQGTQTNLDTLSNKTVRLAVLRNVVFEGVDDTVANEFDRRVSELSASAVSIKEITIPVLNELSSINSKGGFAAAEAYAWHAPLLKERSAEYDPRVSSRIVKGSEQSAADYIELLQHRQRIIQEVDEMTGEFDAVIYPTVPFVAPPIKSFDSDDEYARLNLLALRNPSVTNFLNRCAVSIPIHAPGDAPVGLNLMGHTLQDRRLLAIAKSIASSLI
jgi:aspartyl-tRNA(Asn)/glutamyl-tRNA(Gln) amidotransferase subunit A